MDLPVNRFKQRLRSGEAQIGLWLGLADPYCAELAANAGSTGCCWTASTRPTTCAACSASCRRWRPTPASR